MNGQLEVEEFEVIVDGIEELLDPDRKCIYAENAKNELNSIMGNKHPVTYEFGYIGKGAASEALIIAIAIFFSGKKIEENFDSWLRLINRVKHFFEKRRQGANIYVSLRQHKHMLSPWLPANIMP